MGARGAGLGYFQRVQRSASNAERRRWPGHLSRRHVPPDGDAQETSRRKAKLIWPPGRRETSGLNRTVLIERAFGAFSSALASLVVANRRLRGLNSRNKNAVES